MRRRHAVPRGCPRHLDWASGAAISPNIDNHFPVFCVRVGYNLINRAYRSARNAGPYQTVGQFLAREPGQRCLNLLFERFAIEVAFAIGSEARVCRKIMPTNNLAESRELAVVADCEEDRVR